MAYRSILAQLWVSPKGREMATSRRYPNKLDIYLSDVQLEALREVAEELDRPMSSTVRQFIASSLKRRQGRKATVR